MVQRAVGQGLDFESSLRALSQFVEDLIVVYSQEKPVQPLGQAFVRLDHETNGHQVGDVLEHQMELTLRSFGVFGMTEPFEKQVQQGGQLAQGKPGIVQLESPEQGALELRVVGQGAEERIPFQLTAALLVRPDEVGEQRIQIHGGLQGKEAPTDYFLHPIINN